MGRGINELGDEGNKEIKALWGNEESWIGLEKFDQSLQHLKIK